MNVNDSNAAPNSHAAKLSSVANQISLTNSGEITGKSVEDYCTVPGARPNFSTLSFTTYWKLRRQKHVIIKPGETYFHTMNFKPFCIDQALHESLAKINPFRTRKLLVCAYGEKAAVDGADFATSAPCEINRKMRTFGQFRAMPYQKRRSDVILGSGGVDLNTLPCYKTAADQDKENPDQMTSTDMHVVNEDGNIKTGEEADGIES